MNINRKILLGIFFSLCACLVYSQELYMEDIVMRRAAEKVAQMNDYISFMASKKKPTEDRKRRKTMALNLFMGKGFSYEVDGVEKDGVMIEFVSPSGEQISRKLLRECVNDIYMKKITNVHISLGSDRLNMSLSNYRHLVDNIYTFDLFFVGATIMFSNGDNADRRFSVQQARCLLFKEESEDGPDCIIQFGDITLRESENNK